MSIFYQFRLVWDRGRAALGRFGPGSRRGYVGMGTDKRKPAPAARTRARRGTSESVWVGRCFCMCTQQIQQQRCSSTYYSVQLLYCCCCTLLLLYTKYSGSIMYTYVLSCRTIHSHSRSYTYTPTVRRHWTPETCEFKSPSLLLFVSAVQQYCVLLCNCTHMVGRCVIVGR